MFNPSDLPAGFFSAKDPAEKFLWIGKPSRTPFRLSGISFLVLGLVWAVFVFFGVFGTLKKGEYAVMASFFVLHLVPFYASVFNAFYQKRVYRHTFYAVTNKRILSQSGFWGTAVRSAGLGSIADIAISINPIEKKFGQASLKFRLERGAGDVRELCFMAIEKSEEVCRLVREAASDRKKNPDSHFSESSTDSVRAQPVIRLFAAVLFAAVAYFAAGSFFAHTPSYLVFDMMAEKGTHGDLYLVQNRLPVNEEDCVSFVVRPGREYRTYRIRIWKPPFRGLVLMPTDSPGTIVIRNVRIECGRGSYPIDIASARYLNTFWMAKQSILLKTIRNDPLIYFNKIPSWDDVSSAGRRLAGWGAAVSVFVLLGLGAPLSWVRRRVLAAPGASSKSSRHSVNFARVWVVLSFVWFAGQALYFMQTAGLNSPPDEGFHFSLSQLYAGSRSFEESLFYDISSSTTQPYAYHGLMGFALKLFHGSDPLHFLRFLNILLACGVFYGGYLLARDTIPDPWVRACAVWLQANVLMFSFEAGGVTYDNLTNLCAVFSVLFLVRFVRKPSRRELVFFLLVSMGGMLTKYAYLPLFGLQLVVLALFFQTIWVKGAGLGGPFRWDERVMFAGLAVLAGLCGLLYIGNQVMYGAPCPSLEAVLKQSGIPFVPKAYPYDFHYYPVFGMDFIEWLWRYALRMERSMFGSPYWNGCLIRINLFFYNAFFVAAFIWITMNARRFFKSASMRILCFLGIGYAGIVTVHLWNTNANLVGLFGPTIQGRYLFPVLMLFCILCVRGLTFRLSGAARAVVVALVSGFFFYSGFPFYFSHLLK